MKRAVQWSLILFCGSLLWACGSNQKKESQAGQPPAVQSYPVVTADTQSVSLETDYPAVLEGIQDVDIRPKVDGFIEKIHVDEGATVRKGQLLFSINAPQYEQQVRTANASISRAQASVNAAQLQVNKTRPLVEKDIISRYELEAAELNLQSRKAELAQARAELVNSQVNVGYTRITSPVDGVVGTFPFKTGSLVSSSSAQPLTTVSDISKVYAYFSVNEQQLPDLAKAYGGGTLAQQIRNMPLVSLIRSDGTLYAQKGKIESINTLINTNTGAAGLRATFINPEGVLKTGASAMVRIPRNVQSALLIPQKSTMDLQGKKFVYLVDDKGLVKNTLIEIMPVAKGNFFVVTKGLKAGDRIVLEGFQSLKDGAEIKPEVKNADSVYAELKD